ncbi:hypothetical protein GcM3_164015 [Golovinomyces cichoracearum]|uniref:Uncharacterized protein n=1 Tax=Golovinomyces cichoracearum TaxID=62708 RepID=A0A420HSY1_9PEZI|nr:hypothetical protein GcM3_164015 [Golovinomyces cichoracearum]
MLFVTVSKVFSVALVAMSAMQETYAAPLHVEEIHKANAVLKARSSEKSDILPRFFGALAGSLASAVVGDSLGSTVGPVLSSIGDSLSGKNNQPPAQDVSQGDQGQDNTQTEVQDNTQTGGQVVGTGQNSNSNTKNDESESKNNDSEEKESKESEPEESESEEE